MGRSSAYFIVMMMVLNCSCSSEKNNKEKNILHPLTAKNCISIEKGHSYIIRQDSIYDLFQNLLQFKGLLELDKNCVERPQDLFLLKGVDYNIGSTKKVELFYRGDSFYFGDFFVLKSTNSKKWVVQKDTIFIKLGMSLLKNETERLYQVEEIDGKEDKYYFLLKSFIWVSGAQLLEDKQMKKRLKGVISYVLNPYHYNEDYYKHTGFSFHVLGIEE